MPQWVFVWTISDVIGIAFAAVIAILLGICWVLKALDDWQWKRWKRGSAAKQEQP